VEEVISMTEDYAKRLQTLLRKLFQFESADLDFGIYRIMNRKRDVIEKFIDNDLIASIDTEFGKISETSKASTKKELNDLKIAINKTLGTSALLPSGEFNPQFANTPIGADLAKQYKEKTATYAAAFISDEHKAEIFNHIYQFFSRYFDNGDFMSMRRYSAKQKFAVPYNGEEVLLHWANKDQYYIKTGEYFFNYAFRIGEYTIRFQIVQAATAMNNTKAENRFFVLKNGEGNITYEKKIKELIILFEYRILTESEKASVGSRNGQDTLNEQAMTSIFAAVSDAGLKAGLAREKDGKIPLLKHLATYAKRNTTDYFIHKDLFGFLTQELDFYIKNEMFDLDDLGMDKEVPIMQYLNRVRVMKVISLKIIEFLAQIEDFQKKLFEKKKFVLCTDYCMTLDRVPESFYSEIAKNSTQIAEWKRLYTTGGPSEQATLFEKKGNIIDVEFLKNYPYLVLDTKFFPQVFKDQLLATFDDLDETIGGLLVKSENWQALNLLQDRYREQVKCIYIDPPYNTGSDEFLYKDNYQHSSWLAMMANRLSKTRKLLDQVGLIFISIDYVEVAHLRVLCDSIFSRENFLADIAWEKRYTRSNNAKKFYSLKDTIMVFQNSDKIDILRETRTEKSKSGYTNPDDDSRGPWISSSYVNPATKAERPNLVYSIKNPFTGATVTHPTHAWKYDKQTHDQHVKEKRLYWGLKGDYEFPRLKTFLTEAKEGMVPVDLWNYKDTGTTDDGGNLLKNIFGEVTFSNPKPITLIQRAFELSSHLERTEVFMDFFAGSGTTAHAVLNLNRSDKGNRKYVLIEMASYFDSVLKPRIQKVMYSSEWKDGKPQNTDGISHIFKYLTLEQYEDSLNNIDFMEGGTVQKTLMDMDGYMFRYMLDFETRESPCRMNVAKLDRPFEYTLRITKDSDLHDETVDLVETFNYLLGLKVKRVRTFPENGTTYRIVHGETLAGQPTTVIWRTTVGLDLKKDKEFIEETVLSDPKLKAERIFINGDFHVEGALPIEPEFQRLMGV
jgi:adenine-specific DNA-methyltransferase